MYNVGMDEKEKQEILALAQSFFKDVIVVNHANNLNKLSKLSAYNYNPFLTRYLAKFFSGHDDPKNIAKVLIYPRILGTSINTSFGQNIQKFCSGVLKKFGSTTPGIDIEFVDTADNRKKYCQIKAGPDTINKDDVTTISNHFSAAKNLAKTNNLDLRITDLVIGVLYGNKEDLSANYKKLNERYEIFVGNEFWKRLTGDDSFYFDLIKSFSKVADNINGRSHLHKTVEKLAEDIARNSGLI